MRRNALLTAMGLSVGGSLLFAAPAPAEDSMAHGMSTCAQVRADYPNGIAKTKAAARAAVRAGYRKPFVCKRVYRDLMRLDGNRNKALCEVR